MSRPLIEGRNLKKSYGLQIVIDDLSFLVSENQKVALIGRNGAGKSTLLKMITDVEQPDGGEITFFPWTRLGVVHQNEVLPSDVTSLAYLEQKSGKQPWEIQKCASQFGVGGIELAQPPAALSGGYQMRIKLIAMFLLDPNILLLDEPVNFLDLQTLLLLERFLENFRGSYLLVAHDRTFLQNTCTSTFEIERGKLVTFKGRVQEYFEFKEEQREYTLRTNKKLSLEIAHQQKFVDRFRFKASQATRAQSKIKHIAKLRHCITNINAALATTHIVIPSPHVVAGVALRADGLMIGYVDHVVAENVHFQVNRGEKVIIVGENGRGKSTLLKTLAGKIEPLSGTAKWWKNADIGYYDQQTDKTLTQNETVIAYLTRLAPSDAAGERILMMAGNFLFKGDDLDKTVSVLSGGERARLCLAGMLIHEHNVLLLDEPTNHLDVETAEALAVALKAYTGTVLFVSHARTFVSTLADKIFEVRAGTLRQYMGTYEEYVDDLSVLMDESVDASLPLLAKEGVGGWSGTQRAEFQRRLKEHQRSQDRLNKQISTFDKERSEILAYYFENPMDYSPSKSQRLQEIDEELARVEKNWLKEQEEIDALREKIHGS